MEKTFFIKKIIRCKSLKQALRNERKAEIVDVVMVDDGRNPVYPTNGGSAIGFNSEAPNDYDD